MNQAVLLTPVDGGPRWSVYIVAWLLLAIVLMLRVKVTAGLGPGRWSAVLAPAVAFIIWVHDSTR